MWVPAWCGVVLLPGSASVSSVVDGALTQPAYKSFAAIRLDGATPTDAVPVTAPEAVCGLQAPIVPTLNPSSYSASTVVDSVCAPVSNDTFSTHFRFPDVDGVDGAGAACVAPRAAQPDSPHCNGPDGAAAQGASPRMVDSSSSSSPPSVASQIVVGMNPAAGAATAQRVSPPGTGTASAPPTPHGGTGSGSGLPCGQATRLGKRRTLGADTTSAGVAVNASGAMPLPPSDGAASSSGTATASGDRAASVPRPPSRASGQRGGGGGGDSARKRTKLSVGIPSSSAANPVVPPTPAAATPSSGASSAMSRRRRHKKEGGSSRGGSAVVTAAVVDASGGGKGPWDAGEDRYLVQLVEKYGPRNWRTIASLMNARCVCVYAYERVCVGVFVCVFMPVCVYSCECVCIYASVCVRTIVLTSKCVCV